MIKSGREGEFCRKYVIDGLTVIRRLEGSMTSCQLVKSDACGPNINFFSVASTCEHFRSSVIKSASNCKHFKFGASPSVFPADSIIYQLESFGYWIVKDVLGFNISMAHCPLMKVMQGLQQLLSDFP